MHDRRCEYTQGDMRCPMPGTLSDGIGGQGRWWCAWHADASRRGSGRAAEATLRDLVEHRAELLEERYGTNTIHGTCIPPVQERYEHPAMRRRDDETLSDYVARMRRWQRQILARPRQSRPEGWK